MARLPAMLFALLLLSTQLAAQRNISGIVIEVKSGQPLVRASVYISNTSLGTITDSTGFFQLTDLPMGQLELIVSSIGFETNVFSFSTEQLPLRLKVEMLVKVEELQNVTVEPSVIEGWGKWGQTFTETFIGLTPNARKCRIKNYRSIHFRFFSESNRLIAWSDEPLVVENKALGYTLRYELENFEVFFDEGFTTFHGHPFFEDHGKGTAKKTNRWLAARDSAYAGSMMEFMRSIYRNSLKADGYEVRRMTRAPNYEKERVTKIYNPDSVYRTSVNRIAGHRAKKGTRDTALSAVNDSIIYYKKILTQKDVIETFSPYRLTADSLIIKTEGAYKLVWFDKYLYITYDKKNIDPMYLVNLYWLTRNPSFEGSYIQLRSGTPVVIDANGNYSPPQEVFATAYWGWSEKISNLLPMDFQPRR